MNCHYCDEDPACIFLPGNIGPLCEECCKAVEDLKRVCVEIGRKREETPAVCGCPLCGSKHVDGYGESVQADGVWHYWYHCHDCDGGPFRI